MVNFHEMNFLNYFYCFSTHQLLHLLFYSVLNLLKVNLNPAIIVDLKIFSVYKTINSICKVCNHQISFLYAQLNLLLKLNFINFKLYFLLIILFFIMNLMLYSIQKFYNFSLVLSFTFIIIIIITFIIIIITFIIIIINVIIIEISFNLLINKMQFSFMSAVKYKIIQVLFKSIIIDY